MRQLIFIFIFTLSANVYAQVEENEQGVTHIKRDSYDLMDAEPELKVPSDEVRVITNMNDGKMSFSMGDDSKKGLYDWIGFTNENKFYIVKKGNRYGIANKKAEITVNIQYDSIGEDYFNKTGFIAKQDGKYGIISGIGEIIIPIRYNKIIASNQYNTMVINGANSTELISNKQQNSLRKNIDYAAFYSNLTIIKSEGKFGIIQNEIIVPFEYDSIYIPIRDPMLVPIGDSYNRRSNNNQPVPNPLIITSQNVTCLAIQKNNRVGLVNSEGEVIYTANNDVVYNNEMNGYCSVKNQNLYGIYFIKSKDKKRTAIEFDRISTDGYGAIMASKNQKMGIFSVEGNQITPFEYDNEFIMRFSGVGYLISKDKKRGVIDLQGKVILPPKYDEVSTISFNGRDGFKVKINEKYGIVSREGKVVIPVEFEYINDLMDNYLIVQYQNKVGLYDRKGNKILPAKYKHIWHTPTPETKVLLLIEQDGSFNFLDVNNKIIFLESVIDYGYVLDQDLLKQPEGLMGLLYVKSKSGKYGLFNEITGKLCVPMVYDKITQYVNIKESHCYFSVCKGKAYGLINEKNQVIIPLKYDAMNLTLAPLTSAFDEVIESQTNDNDFQIVVAKDKKYGTVNLKDKVVIPFQYSFLKRISSSGLFKAKTGNKYQIINKYGKPITKSTFDEVANFEFVYNNYRDEYVEQALTFSKGKMRVIDDKGNFITDEIAMQPHNGYATFDELKSALIKALNSKNDSLFLEFVEKIAPSEHILYVLNRKPESFSVNLEYVEINDVKLRYLVDLIRFKVNDWNADTSYGYPGYNRSSLNVVDYTQFSERYGFVTNLRVTDHAYGDGFMENLLRNAIRVNGYWISTYFMNRRFNRY
ncbi:MAG: WG repeat-containing protein [Bacteroidota bacterium]